MVSKIMIEISTVIDVNSKVKYWWIDQSFVEGSFGIWFYELIIILLWVEILD